MRRARPILAVLLFAAALVPPSHVQAGAWVPEAGSGYAKLWTKWLYGFGYHDGDDRTHDYGGYQELFLASYGEYGLVSGVALTWHMDLVRAAWLEDPVAEETRAHATVGDPRLGARFELLKSGRLVVAGELSALAPLADDDALQPFIYADGTSAGALRLGAGVWEFAASTSAGLGFDGFYTQLGAGYLLRSDGFDDVLQFQLEGGADLSAKFAARLRVTGHLALEADDAPYLDNPAGVGNGVSYVGFALEADYKLTPAWYLGLTAEGGLLAIRRQTGGPVLSIYTAHIF